MRKINLLLLLVIVCGFASAQIVPTHDQYVKIGGSTSWYTAYENWSPGTALYSGDSEAAENEQFFISRVKPRERFVFTGTQVKESLNPERKLLWWCPIGTTEENWNAIPSYYFGGEVFSMWSYTDIYNSWTTPMIQAPAAFLDACHKNGVHSGVTAAVPFGAAPSPNDGGHGSNINALVTGGYDKLLKYLRYYGVDCIGFNSEFGWINLNTTAFKEMMGNCYANAASYGVPFNNAWYSYTSNGGTPGDYSVLNSGCDEWFHYKGKKVSDAYFLNYNWYASHLNTSQQTAESHGRSSFDVYAGMDYQGRSTASWRALQNYNISVGFWGALNMNMIYESCGELGSSPKQKQKTYQLISENSFTGSSYNPVNTPDVTDILRHTSTATDFHGFSSFITARSTMTPQYGDGTLAGDPFVTYFNLGNGMFFKEEGVTTFNQEWYNLGMQDYLPSWRWWWTKTFMGKNATDASTDMVAEFTWDDAWFGGSCLQISGSTDKAYLQLFKTKYPLVNNDVFTIRYKVVSGSGTIALTTSTESAPTTEIAGTIVSNAEANDEWKVKEIKVADRNGIKLNGETLALLGLKFEDTSFDFKVLIGEISVTRGTSITPGMPAIVSSKAMARNYKGVDMKIVYDMTAHDKNSSGRQSYQSIYNTDVNTWYYKIYTQQEGGEPVLCTATTSWAAYVVGAPYDLEKGGKIRIGVSAVSLDGNRESSISWGSYMSVPANQTVEGFSIDKPIIKAGEEFTVAFDDPTHPAATWVIKASENDEEKGTFNAKSFTTSLSEEGIYDLYLIQNGTTEVYRGKIQISPAAVGAMPEIKTLTMRGANDKEWIEVGEEVTYSYTGRADADGYVSRGMALREKAFGIPTEQLDFDDQSKFSLSFWFKVNQFNHEEYGTQFVNIRSAASIWPESDWGYFWSLFDHENKFSVSFRSNLSSSGMKIEMLEDISFDEGVWYHVAFVYGYTDDNRTLEIYLNGKLHCSCQLGDYGIISWKSSNIIMIGGRAFGRAGLDGVIDEVRLYNKALTAEEIKSTMQHHLLPVTDENFIGYWDFETDSNSENCLISTGGNTSLIAKLYDPSVPSSEGNEYLSQSISFIVGVPFISGTNYKIKTLPSWTLKQASVISTEGDSEAGSATALYSEAGTYTATLTLSNGWGSDTKTIEVVTIVGTGIEDDVTLEEMQAFPNPFDNEVYANFVEEGNYTVEIYDYSGRLLNTIVLYASAGEIYQIPVEGISGIYFIKVKGESGLLKVMKVAKR
ncbi:MAG: T9SS type A sorting domain-containing protein [Bacteroidales bacterium]|nr:T9SS type A sorting domain-containing protein [Bacteroidales bacterium]